MAIVLLVVVVVGLGAGGLECEMTDHGSDGSRMKSLSSACEMVAVMKAVRWGCQQLLR